MKKLFLLCVIAVLAIGAITAKENNNVKTTVFTSGDIYCQSCVNKIMNNIPTLGKGIEDVKVDVQTKTVTVKYNTSKNNDQNIIKGLKKLDVNAMVMAGNAQQSGSRPLPPPTAPCLPWHKTATTARAVPKRPTTTAPITRRVTRLPSSNARASRPHPAPPRPPRATMTRTATRRPAAHAAAATPTARRNKNSACKRYPHT